MTPTPSPESGTDTCGRKHHPFDGVCAPAWVEKLSIACSRGDDSLCEWPVCGCPCHDEEGSPESPMKNGTV